jgi:methyl-accepting chemotaxis protein
MHPWRVVGRGTSAPAGKRGRIVDHRNVHGSAGNADRAPISTTSLMGRLRMRAKLYLAFALISGLVVASAIAATIWTSNSNAEILRNLSLADFAERQSTVVELKMMTMSDAMRGYLLDPSKQVEYKRKLAADDELSKAVGELKGALAEMPSVLQRIAAIETYDEQILNKAEDRLLEMVKKDIDAAKRFYETDYLPLRERETGLVLALRQEIAQVKEAVRAEAAETRAEQFVLELCGAAVMLIFSGLLAWLSGRVIAGPILRMTAAMGQLAGGDKTVEIPAHDSKDEIGDMAKAVDVFKQNMIRADQIAAEQKAEQAKKEQRQVAIEGFIATFESGVRGSLDTLASAATEMRATSQSMSTTAEETSAQATTVAAAAEQASANVQTVAAATEELSSSVAEIGRQVIQSTKIAGQAVDEAGRTNVTVQGLSAAAQKIGDVVKLISDIASQTNLLALNATIEAARAGDAGKGFAVVASEVKSLANQTAKATEEISAQVAAMQGATSGVVQAIQSIGGTIGSINEIATTIASAVEEQGAATQEIARNVQEAAQGTSQVSSTIAGVNQAASETGAASSQVLASAEELGKQAETLRADIDSFLANIRAA